MPPFSLTRHQSLKHTSDFIMNLLQSIRVRPVVLLLGSLLSAFPAGAAWKRGDTLPDLTAFGLDGNLPHLEGKVVLIDFWASWCAPCKASFPALDSIYESFREKGVIILGVNVDTNEGAYEKFMKRMAPAFPVVRDASQKLVAAAGVATMPSSYLIDGNGVITEVHAGYHGNKTKDEYIAEIEALLAESGKDPS